MRSLIASSIVFVACTTSSTLPVTADPGEQTGATGSGKADGTATPTVPDVRCDGSPDAGPAGSFRHITSRITADLADPRHRGFDLVAPASADTQTIEGWISYGPEDKALEDEDVDVFACREAAWAKLGTARTDGEGHFVLELADAARLPIAMRDLYVSVVGDRTGTEFLAYVAPDDAPLIVSDVDGTLTSSENAFFETIVLGIEPDAQPNAAAAYRAAAQRGYQLAYVTSRGGQYTSDTRQWLSDQGFPRGPVRLSPSFVTLPGDDTIDYKTATISALGFPIAMGIGNRATDITAYTSSGVAPTSIMISLPDYQSEVQPALDAGQAIGFTGYDQLRTTAIANLPVL
jgi:phosphatidate phosphatase PAH1